MAQAGLVKTTLTPEMITAGRVLLAELDASGLVFDAAFWLLDDEIGEWRLILASPLVRSSGPRVLYRAVNEALAKLELEQTLSLLIISVVDQREPTVRLLTRALGMARSVDGARLDNAIIDGKRVPGVLLYRLTRKQAKASQAAPGKREMGGDLSAPTG